MKQNQITGIILTLVISLSITACNQKSARKADTLKAKTEDRKVSPVGDALIFSTLSDSLRLALLNEGDQIVKEATAGIKSQLVSAMKKGGPEYAVSFCNTKAMPITDSISAALNVDIRRIAVKNRNPKNITNAKENKILKGYIYNYLNASLPRPQVLIDNQGHPVFYKLIKVNQECLVCHGKPETEIPSGVAEKIRNLYPQDKAIDFKAGEPRGMWAITFDNIIIQ